MSELTEKLRQLSVETAEAVVSRRLDSLVGKGMITDTDRLDHLFAMARRGGMGMYIPAGCNRDAIDTLIANK